MALVNRSFSVNVTPGMMPPIVHVSEYDVGRAYTVSILDEQGNTFTIPSGTTASIEGTLNGSVGFTQSATVSNNQVSFTLSQSMTAYSGKAWCKIKLTQNSQPIQTCAFVLAVDRAGVEAGTVIGAPGFEEQIADAVDDWLDAHPPASGGLTEDVKQALLDCFENVAWINDDGQDYYDALYAALYPPADLASISATFTQGSHVVYNTDTLDSLKPYLTVRAVYTDATTQTVTNYTLSGTLTVGTSQITVSYGGKTTTFTVTVTEYVPTVNYVEVGSPSIVNNVLYPANSNGGYIRTPQEFNHGSNPWRIKFAFSRASQSGNSNAFLTADASGERVRAIQAQFVSTFLQVYLSSNNSSWDILAGTSIRYENFELDTKYVVEYSFDGAKYSIAITDENGDPVISGYFSSSASIYDGGYLCFGLVTTGTTALDGQIFLEDIEVYIDNQLWWKAVE